MKTKIFTLLGLSILTLVMIASFASAEVLATWPLTADGTPSGVNANANAGTFTNGSGTSAITFTAAGASATNWTTASTLDSTDYFQISIAPKTGYELSLSKINFTEVRDANGTTTYQVQYSKSSAFSSPTTIGTYTSATTEANQSLSVSIDATEGETIYIRWYAYSAANATGTWSIGDGLNLEGAVTKLPEEIVSCATTGNPSDDLVLEIKDIKVTSGFGKDEEWLPLDEIEVELQVENDNDDYKIKDIAVEWGLFDRTTQKWYIDDKESEFNLNENTKKTLTLTFKLDDDIDKLAEGDYVFYVWANGFLNDASETDLCASDSRDISIIVESDFVILYNLQFPEVASCGTDFEITADIWNIGDQDQEGVYVLIYNKELGINQKVLIGDVDALDYEDFSAMITLPKDAEEKKYDLTLSIYNEDDEVFQNDFDDDKAEFLVSVKVEGSCVIDSHTIVVADLESGGKAGEELSVKVTVTNTGSSSRTFSVSLSDYNTWSELVSTSESSITLASGESKDIIVKLNVNKDASGTKKFNLNLESDGKIITQPVEVLIEKSSFSLLTGNIITEGNWYLWGIGAVNVVLVLIIIIVAVKLVRKS